MSLKQPIDVLSRWSTMVEGLQQSSREFYTETTSNLAEHQLKDVRTEHVTMSEGGVFSAKREYLQIRHRDFVYHVCAAPYGNGFFVSSWLGQTENGFVAWLASIRFIGPIVKLFASFFKPLTYYKIDTAQMFHSVVHGAVTKALDRVISAQGKRALTEAERKPVMRDLFDRFR